MAGGDKASFLNVDQGKTFTVQFNPKEFTLEETSAWKDSDEFQQEDPQLTYDRNKPSTIKMDLIFDTTDSGSDVHSTWVKNIRSFLSVAEKDKEAKNHDVIRPPYLQFNWGSFSFDCVCENITSQFLMFKADGTPLRAKVSVTLKGRRQYYETSSSSVDPLSAMASMMSGTGTAKEKSDPSAIGGNAGESKHKSSADFTKEYKSKPNDSISDVAKATNTDVKLIAAANGLNPLDPAPPIVIIPSSAAVAAIFEHLNKSESPAAWGDVTPNLNPDSAPGDDWNIDKGEYEHGLSEGQIEFSNYSSEHSYADENEASFSEAYGGEVEKNEYSQGESQASDEWNTDKNGGIEHEYGAENEASFSEAYGGDVEKNEYAQGDSASSDGMDISENEGVEHSYGEENKAEFSERGDGKVDPTEYSQAEGSSSDDMDISKNEGVEHKVGKENEASFSDTKTGDAKANEISHGDSAAAGGPASAGGGKAEAASSGGGAGAAGAGGSGGAAGGDAGGGAAAGGADAGGAGGGASTKSTDQARTDAQASKAADSASDTASDSAEKGADAGASASGAASKSGGAADKAGAGAADKAGAGAADKAGAGAADKAGADAATGKAGADAADKAGDTASAKDSAAAAKAGAGAKKSDVASETSRSDDRTSFRPGSNPGDSKMTKATREVDQAVAGAEKVAKDVDKAVKAPSQAQKDLTNQAKTIAAKAEMHKDRITGETTEATD